MSYNIVQVNTYNQGGGAERIAFTLHDLYMRKGHNACLLVKRILTDCEQAIEFQPWKYGPLYSRFWYSISKQLSPYAGKIKGAGKVQEYIDVIARPKGALHRFQGKEDFDFQCSRRMFDHLPFQVDLIHCHNLHGGYFDLSYLAELSKQLPVVITCHDEWWYTGHCAYTLGCEKWETGCGNCPDLLVPMAVSRDATNYNWNRKKDIFEKSLLYIVTPSDWLLKRSERSVLAKAIASAKVIHNGVNLEIFKPADRAEVRASLGLPKDAKIILFAANGVRKNLLKDFATLRRAVSIIAEKLPDTQLLFYAVGEESKPEKMGRATIEFVPFVDSFPKMAAYYQAADVYAHAAVSDNFPTTIIESMACGTPVVATAVGGIPEEITDDVTGYLVPQKDAAAMAARICELLTDDDKLKRMGTAAVEYARQNFDEDRMASEYLDWYEHVISDWHSRNNL